MWNRSGVCLFGDLHDGVQTRTMHFPAALVAAHQFLFTVSLDIPYLLGIFEEEVASHGPHSVQNCNRILVFDWS